MKLNRKRGGGNEIDGEKQIDEGNGVEGGQKINRRKKLKEREVELSKNGSGIEKKEKKLNQR